MATNAQWTVIFEDKLIIKQGSKEYYNQSRSDIGRFLLLFKELGHIRRFGRKLFFWFFS